MLNVCDGREKSSQSGGVKKKKGGEMMKKKMMADFGLGGEKIWLGPWGCGGLEF